MLFANIVVHAVEKFLWTASAIGFVRTYKIRDDPDKRFVCAATDDGTVPLCCYAGWSAKQRLPGIKANYIGLRSKPTRYRCVEKLPPGYRWCPDCQRTYFEIHGVSGLDNHSEKEYCKRSIIINLDI
jgi:hypothetical protein